MAIITLTSDYGTTDHYVASLKGYLLSVDQQLSIVDVTHSIKNFDIVQAAFVLRHAFPAFPEGTIHCVIVHHRHEEQQLLCFEKRGHFFIVPDNGIATLMFDDVDEVYVIPFDPDVNNWPKRVAKCAGAIAGGAELQELGSLTRDIVRRIHLSPVVSGAMIRGAAIYIDHYDNVVFNVTRELFEKECQGRPFKLFYKRYDPLEEIHEDYYSVPVGEVVARFNTRGFLELGINMGRAASLLGIKVDDMIQIHFDD